MDISENIKEIRFAEMEQYDCSKIVGFISEKDKWYGNISWAWIIRWLFLGLFADPLKYILKDMKGEGKILFAFNEPKEWRYDVYQMMLDLYSCSDNAIFIEVERKINYFSPKESCSRLLLLRKWWSQLSITALNKKQKLAVVASLLNAKTEIKRIMPFLDHEALVVRYDVTLWDSVPVQFFNLNNKKTVTAQHGVMCATREVPYYGIWFRNCASNFFLAWNEMTKKEALKDGMSEERVKVCGIAKCINAKKCNPPKNGVIGLLLDGYDFINKGIISVAEVFCKRHNYKYKLRYHPNYKGDEYDQFVNQSFCLGVIKGTIEEYASQVEFTIMGNSTALLELLYMHHPVYVYSTDSEYELYNGYIEVVHNEKELESLVSSPDYSDVAFNNLVSVDDIRSEYGRFFNELIYGKDEEN